MEGNLHVLIAAVLLGSAAAGFLPSPALKVNNVSTESAWGGTRLPRQLLEKDPRAPKWQDVQKSRAPGASKSLGQKCKEDVLPQ